MRRAQMTRQELQSAFESAILETVLACPCVSCGGDQFTVRANARAGAYYLFELIKSALGKDGKLVFTDVTIEHAVERADKKTAKFFAELSTEELEKLLSSGPGELEMPEDSVQAPEIEALVPQPEPEVVPETPANTAQEHPQPLQSS